MMEMTGSRHLDNGNRNELVLDVRMNETTVPDVRMNETTGSGCLDNGNQNELFSLASTLASDIRYMNELEVQITHGSLDI
ncbi:unnamed protein product [Rhizophagus irregularis]|uniref:Uncharacterized protein n=1 Tax=Rhizophagus irregularis TaxID=588596 RepID=A0A916E044_9GLOM|nr:unnamed protein product [Rhizophagus irregularis]